MKSDTLINKAVSAQTEGEQLPLICQILKLKPSSVMGSVRQLAGSALAVERYIAAWIMGELGFPKKPFIQERFRLLNRLSTGEKSSKVRARAIYSIGQLEHPRSLELLLEFAPSKHASDRLAAAQALPHYASLNATDALLKLAADTKPTVREWAFFGLGNREYSQRDERVVDALDTGVTDSYRPAAYEAIRGLVAIGEVNRFGVLVDKLDALKLHPTLVHAVNELVCLLEEKNETIEELQGKQKRRPN